MWNLTKEPANLAEAKLFAEEMMRRHIERMKQYDAARYTYAWRENDGK